MTNLLVMLLSFLFMFLSIEYFLWSFYNIYAPELTPRLVDDVGFDANPNLLYPEMRDQDYPFEKATGTYRILALGDSFTWGQGVYGSHAWPKQLEAGLRARGKDAVEVINGGYLSWNTSDELEYLKDRGLDFDPDMLILGYFLNDSTDMNTNPLLVEGYAEKNIRKTPSMIVNIIQRAIIDMHTTKLTAQEYEKAYFENTALWEKSQNALLKIRDIAEENNMEFVVAIFPILFQLNNDYPFSDIISTIKSFLDQNGIRNIDLLPYYLGKKDKTLWAAPNDAHPNQAGHTIAASAILDIIEADIR